jgi:MFS transporter, OFA family, oxalate/formate antiporter
MTRLPRAQRWLTLLAALSVLTIGFSFPRFSLPRLYPALVSEFHWNSASAVAGGSIVLLLIGIFSPVIGWLVDKYGAKRVLLAGIATVALSLALLSIATDLELYYASCLLLGLGISAVSILPTSLLIAPWFRRGRGSAVGFINAGIGLGGFIAPLLTNAQLGRRGISGAFLVLACWMVVPFILTLLTEGGIRGGAATDPEGIPRAHTGNAGPWKVAHLLRLPMFWIFGLSVFFAAHAMTAVQENLILYLRGQGMSGARAALALSIAIGSSAPGKLLSGAITDRFSARLAAMLSVFCVGLAILGLLAIDPHSELLFVFAVVFGFGYGGTFNAPPMIVFEYFGTRQVGAVLGVFLVFFGLGTSSGGVLAGYLFDRTHRYSVPFTLDLAIAAVSLLLLLAGARQTRAVAVPSVSAA